MAEPRSIWVGRDEHEGVLAQPRKDLKQPPPLAARGRGGHPAATLADGGRGPNARGLHRGHRDLGRLAPRPGRTREARALPPAGRPPRTGRTPNRACRRTATSWPMRTRATSVSRPPAGGPARRREGSSPVWIDDAHLVIGVERADTTRLAVVESDDAWPRRLARGARREAPGDEGAAAVSPDGSQIAYVFYPRGDLNRSEIRVAGVAGGEVRALTGTPRMHDREPAWSPDGRQIAYTSERSGFYELHLVAATARANASSRPRAPTTPRSTGTPTAAPGGHALPAQPLRPRGGGPRVRRSDGGRRGRHVEPSALDRGGALVAAYEDHATPPELRVVTPEPSRDPPRPGAQGRANRPLRCARGGGLHLFRRSRDTGVPDAPARAAPRGAGARGGLSPRRSHHVLRRRMGRPRPVLPRSRLRLALSQLPRVHRLRARVRASEPRCGEPRTRATAWPPRTICARLTGSTASGWPSSAPATAPTWPCCP